MQPLQSLRRASFLARLVLAWFVLSIGAAVASPVVKPVGMELVCSASGAIKLVATGDDSTTAASSHTLDCPLCLIAGAPPVAYGSAFSSQVNLAQPQSADTSSQFAKVAAASLPARGPPSFVAL
ncbi:hypothetical protein [Caenimonas sp. SL110]|uniref:hypothetical protein n=1 Tax=Caenimonas sp. SL110 TaxID=1450524 RepID=UPI000652BE85|nr:hypothetical protein [Caenimonas sp. SL110]